MSIVTAKIPILQEKKVFFESATFDGENYYFLETKNYKIYVLDKEYHLVRNYQLENLYHQIIYSNKDLFYLYSSTNIHQFIETDKNFSNKKTKYFPRFLKGNILSLGYNELEDSFYFIKENEINFFNHNDKHISTIKKDLQNNTIISSNSNLYIVQDEITEFTAITTIYENCYIAYNRDSDSYLAKIKDGVIIEEYLIDTNCRICAIINVYGNIRLFVNKKDSYFYHTDLFVEEKEIKKSFSFEKNSNTLHKNEYHIHDTVNNCSCRKCKNMQSIAIEEQKILTMLNDEKEKFSNIVKNSQTSKELSEANQSIAKKIDEITILQQNIYKKLEEMLKDDYL